MTNWTQFWLTFVASSLDINGCVLNYFEGTVNLHYYTSCTLTTLHCSKVSFLQCCHMKRYNKILTKMWGVYSLLWDTVCMLPYVYTFFCTGSSCLQVRFLVRVNIPGMCNSVLKYSSTRPWQRWSCLMKTMIVGKRIWLVIAAIWAAPWALIV